jgi:hypothetical protein
MDELPGGAKAHLGDVGKSLEKILKEMKDQQVRVNPRQGCVNRSQASSAC